MHAVFDALALKVLPFTFHLLNVYPVTPVMAGFVVNVLPYVQLEFAGGVPYPDGVAHFNVMVFALQFGEVLLPTAAFVAVKVLVKVVPLLPT